MLCVVFTQVIQNWKCMIFFLSKALENLEILKALLAWIYSEMGFLIYFSKKTLCL